VRHGGGRGGDADGPRTGRGRVARGREPGQARAGDGARAPAADRPGDVRSAQRNGHGVVHIWANRPIRDGRCVNPAGKWARRIDKCRAAMETPHHTVARSQPNPGRPPCSPARGPGRSVRSGVRVAVDLVRSGNRDGPRRPGDPGEEAGGAGERSKRKEITPQAAAPARSGRPRSRRHGGEGRQAPTPVAVTSPGAPGRVQRGATPRSARSGAGRPVPPRRRAFPVVPRGSRPGMPSGPSASSDPSATQVREGHE
jgi:hypothetical protein